MTKSHVPTYSDKNSAPQSAQRTESIQALLLCKWHIPSNFYVIEKIDLFFEIPSLFTGCSLKVPKGVPGVPGVQKCFL